VLIWQANCGATGKEEVEGAVVKDREETIPVPREHYITWTAPPLLVFIGVASLVPTPAVFESTLYDMLSPHHSLALTWCLDASGNSSILVLFA